MIFRAIVLLALLAGIGWRLDREQREGRFQQADDLFLDFLVANARERFSLDPSKLSDDVVLVRMREEEQAEFGAWPPPPIDWQMVLKGLRAFEPRVVVVATPLTWGEPAPEFVTQLGESLLPLTSALAVEVKVKSDSKAEPGAASQLKDKLPAIPRVSGEIGSVPSITSVVAMPDEAVRRQMELGIIAEPVLRNKAAAMPFVASAGESMVPSLLQQALTLSSRTPYARQRMIVGPGAGAYLGDGLFVPLANDARLEVPAAAKIPEVNALNFMTGSLADSLTAEDKSKLGRNKIIVIGIDRDGGEATAARLHAAALAQVLALPRIRAIGEVVRWIICGVAALLGCFLLRYRGGKAFRSGLLLIFLAMVASYLTFQSQLTWFAPTVPAALLAASTLFAMVFGRSASKQSAPITAESSPVTPGLVS